MTIPNVEKSYFTYKEGVRLTELSIEVQLACEDNTHVWHIFLHITKADNLVNGTKYYNIGNCGLYDAVTQAIHNFDLTYNTRFYSLCVLRGDWDRHGNAGLTSNKRTWYYIMFDNNALAELTQELTEDQLKHIEQYL